MIRPVSYTHLDVYKRQMWGWGSVIADEFNLNKISVENRAMAGRSARTFLDEGRWDKVYNALQPGDFVLIQFGHNDAGDINVGKARAELQMCIRDRSRMIVYPIISTIITYQFSLFNIQTVSYTHLLRDRIQKYSLQ